MAERYYKHDLIERVIHWTLAVSCVLLILSGFQLSFPSVETGPGFKVFGTINTARFVHFLAMYIFGAAAAVWIYQFLALRKYQGLWLYRAEWRNFLPTVSYYLFLRAEKPSYEKYNPLQRLTYLLIMLLAVLQTLWGFGLYWQQALWGPNEIFGGVLNVRALHRLTSWLFTGFLIVHLYLVLTEDIRSLWAMLHGYGYRKAPGAAQR